MHSLDQLIMHTIFLVFAIPLIFLLLLKTKTKFSTQKNKNQLPPSPPKLPLLGHLHLIGSLPHRSLWKLSTKYGPVMRLHLGSVPTIVISSAAAARDLFKLHDLASCSRPPLSGSGRLSYNFLDISFSPYGDHWREVRKICVLELFSVRRVQSFRGVREHEVGLLINSIAQSSTAGAPVDVSEKSYCLTASIITRVAFGKSFRGGELDNEKFEEVIRRGLVVVGSFSATDFFPSFGWIIDWMNGVRGRLEKSFSELDSFFQHVIDHRLKFGATCDDDNNILDVLLKMERERSEFDALQLSRDCIKALTMDIFLAGVDTGAGTIVWAMAELIKNPRVMKKLQDEIRSSIKEEDGIVKESHLEKLEYLKMVVKEVLRLHPPGPLLLPRETMSHFKLGGYDIEPKAHLHVNVWAIGRDPESWTDPDEFLPERFVGSNIDFRGQNFELLPFGAGRRSCPGMHMATVAVELALANMLLCFDWKLPQGMKEEDLDVEEDAGLTVTKKSPLHLIPVEYFK